MTMLNLVLLLCMSLLLFAAELGCLPRADSSGDNGRLPIASAIFAFTNPFIGYRLWDGTFNMIDKRLEYTLEAVLLLLLLLLLQ